MISSSLLQPIEYDLFFSDICAYLITIISQQVLMKSSLVLAMSIYSSVAVLAAVCCFLLPLETKGKEMKDGLSKK